MTNAATSSKRAFKVRPVGANSAALASVDAITAPESPAPGAGGLSLVPAQESRLDAPQAVRTGIVGEAFPPPNSIIDVEIETLIANPANARRLVSASALDVLVAKLQAHGQLSAILIFFDEKGRPTLIDGHRRVAGGKQLGWPTVRCEVRPRPASLAELYLHSRVANAQHETQTPLDDALVWRDLLEKKVFESQAALARSVGVQEADVSRTLALIEIPKTLMLLLVERPHLLTLRMLTAIRSFTKAHGAEAAESLLLEIDHSGLSARQVEKRMAAQGGPVMRPRSDRHPFTWGGMKGEIRRFDKDGRMELSIKKLEPDALRSLEETLLKALAAQAAIS